LSFNLLKRGHVLLYSNRFNVTGCWDYVSLWLVYYAKCVSVVGMHLWLMTCVAPQIWINI
ncbi:hypothetical protein, partial [Acinetobacter baumannii]|uniref:hypothetical protein n=1 Tax=Acinetobacter baumannii TaxID=470 RepID=UPI001BB46A27